MIEKSKQILLWGIKTLLKRYFKSDLSISEPEKVRDLLELLIRKNELIDNTDKFYALRSIFTQTHFCEQPKLADTQFLHPNATFDLFPIVYPNSNSILNSSLFENVPEVLEKANSDTDVELLLNLLFRYGSNVPILNNENCVLPFYDTIKILTALATSEQREYRLVIGDLSGIQDFIYTIRSKDSLRILRARSFYLELLTKSLAYDICEDNSVTSANILFSGGGNFMLLLPENTGLVKKIEDYYLNINTFFLNHFEGNLHLPIASIAFSIKELNKFQDKWNELYRELEKAKKQKFAGLLTDRGKPKEALKESCDVCHIDSIDIKISDNLCPICTKLLEIGPQLKNIEHIYGTQSAKTAIGLFLPSIHKDKFWNYGLEKSEETIRTFQVNQLELNANIMMFYGDYVTEKVEETGKKRTSDFRTLAQNAIGADLTANLVMDVDNMGLIFSSGIHFPPENSQQFLVLTHTLSRSLDYFFKYALQKILLKPEFRACENILPAENKTENRKLTIVYSGGDDLLLTGAWSDVVECSFDIHESFRNYCCQNSDMGLSGGIYVTQPNFPFYISVKQAQAAEKLAKRNFLCLEQDNPGFYQNRDYSQTKIYDAQKNLLKLKDSITLFYDDAINFMVENMPDIETKKRFLLTIRWDEMLRSLWGNKDEYVAKHLKLFITKDLAKYDETEKRIRFEFPRSFLSKLYLMVNRHQTEKEGVYYLVDLVYNFSRLNRELKTKLNSIYELYNRPEKKERNFILFLPVILNWLELLLRKKGAK